MNVKYPRWRENANCGAILTLELMRKKMSVNFHLSGANSPAGNDRVGRIKVRRPRGLCVTVCVNVSLNEHNNQTSRTQAGDLA